MQAQHQFDLLSIRKSTKHAIASYWKSVKQSMVKIMSNTTLTYAYPWSTDASVWSSNDVMVTIEIGSTDVAIIYIIFFFVATVLLTIAALSHYHTIGCVPVCIQDTLGCRLTEPDRPLMKIMVYFLQILVLYSDTYLAYTIISPMLTISTLDFKPELIAFGILPALFVFIPYLTNVYFAISLFWDTSINNLSRVYFRENMRFFCCLVLISGGCHAAILLVSSKMFGLDIFDCGLNKEELYRLAAKYHRYVVLSQNVPQMMIQLLTVLLLDYKDLVVLFTWFCSMLSLITAVFMTMTSNKQEKIQLTITMRVDINAEEFKADQIDFIKRLGYRNKLGDAIAGLLDIRRDKMQVFKIIPTRAGGIVSIGFTKIFILNRFSGPDPSDAYLNVFEGISMGKHETDRTLFHKFSTGSKSEIPKAMMQIWKLRSPPFVTCIDHFTLLRKHSVTVVRGFSYDGHGLFEVNDYLYHIRELTSNDGDVTTYALSKDEIKNILRGSGEVSHQPKNLDQFDQKTVLRLILI